MWCMIRRGIYTFTWLEQSFLCGECSRVTFLSLSGARGIVISRGMGCDESWVERVIYARINKLFCSRRSFTLWIALVTLRIHHAWYNFLREADPLRVYLPRQKRRWDKTLNLRRTVVCLFLQNERTLGLKIIFKGVNHFPLKLANLGEIPTLKEVYMRACKHWNRRNRERIECEATFSNANCLDAASGYIFLLYVRTCATYRCKCTGTSSPADCCIISTIDTSIPPTSTTKYVLLCPILWCLPVPNLSG